MFSSNPNCYIVTNNKLHYYDSFTSSLLLLSYLIINNVPIYKERRLHRAAALCTHCGGVAWRRPDYMPMAHRGGGAGRWRRGRGVGQTHVDLKELGRHVYIIIIHISHHFYTSCITHSNKREE
jgi:hypothetical protein